jgi:ParB-like chromosome segregation protein Spo0J
MTKKKPEPGKNLRDLLVPNIREDEETDEELRASELYESMKAYGFNEEFPALVDEYDETMVGHRRMRAAKLLGIEPVTKTLIFGDGEKADAERLKLALISNIGSAPMTPKDRKRFAEKLYGRDWSMQAIAEALRVSTMTVSRDLGDVSHDVKRGGTDSLGRKKGGGRPSKPKTAEEQKAAKASQAQKAAERRKKKQEEEARKREEAIAAIRAQHEAEEARAEAIFQKVYALLSEADAHELFFVITEGGGLFEGNERAYYAKYESKKPPDDSDDEEEEEDSDRQDETAAKPEPTPEQSAAARMALYAAAASGVAGSEEKPEKKCAQCQGTDEPLELVDGEYLHPECRETRRRYPHLSATLGPRFADQDGTAAEKDAKSGELQRAYPYKRRGAA